MINWNEVTVGETEISKEGHYRMRLLARNGDYFWTKGNTYHTFHTDELREWTIYDPWEDVSHECRFDDEFCVYHGHHMLIEDDIIIGRYKRDKTGLRVWKRKEG